MYPNQKVWDLKPDDGGKPVQVDVANAAEAIRRDPKRYARELPPAPPAEEHHRGHRSQRGRHAADEGSN